MNCLCQLWKIHNHGCHWYACWARSTANCDSHFLTEFRTLLADLLWGCNQIRNQLIHLMFYVEHHLLEIRCQKKSIRLYCKIFVSSFVKVHVAGISWRMHYGQIEQYICLWKFTMQGSVEGGFMGRTNKLVDGCYSFWQGGLFALLQRLSPELLRQCGVPRNIQLSNQSHSPQSEGPMIIPSLPAVPPYNLIQQAEKTYNSALVSYHFLLLTGAFSVSEYLYANSAINTCRQTLLNMTVVIILLHIFLGY